MNYLKKVYENPEKLKAMRARQKDYYHRVLKPKRALEKAKLLLEKANEITSPS